MVGLGRVSRFGLGMHGPAVDQVGGRSVGPADQEHPWACGGWSGDQAAYRLLDNPAVEWRGSGVHTTRTVARMAGQPVVLCLQDTTELDFTTQPGIAGLGRLS